MPAGRPKGTGKYNATIQAAADRYVDAFGMRGHLLPTIEGLAQVLGVTRRTLHNWDNESEKPDFFHTLGRLRCQQKITLLEKGLTGEFNPAIAKLMLSANHGMHERWDRGVSGADGGPL